jgi:hypothetical protein
VQAASARPASHGRFIVMCSFSRSRRRYIANLLDGVVHAVEENLARLGPSFGAAETLWISP